MDEHFDTPAATYRAHKPQAEDIGGRAVSDPYNLNIWPDPPRECLVEYIDPTGWYACLLPAGHDGPHHDPPGGATWRKDDP